MVAGESTGLTSRPVGSKNMGRILSKTWASVFLDREEKEIWAALGEERKQGSDISDSWGSNRLISDELL